MSFPTTLLLSLKIILISTGAISIAVAIKFSVPSIIAFTCYDLPIVWNSLLKWLKPPYLYLIINGIIITIAASSRFNHHHQSKDWESHQQQEPLISVKTPPPSDVVAAVALAQIETELNMNNVVQVAPPQPVVEEEVYEAEDQESEEAKVVELMPVVVNSIQLEEAVENDDGVDDVASDHWMISEPNLTSPQKIVSPETQLDFLVPVKEKPLLSSRFGHRKPIQTNPEGGRALRPQRLETMESTWKMITERHHVPLTRHLKKSDTWENHGRELLVNSQDQEFPPDHVPKSETFRDRTNYDVPTTPLLKKEPSLSQDELNCRVEAFIKKFNEEMRLQRQESLNKYMEMINRGAY